MSLISFGVDFQIIKKGDDKLVVKMFKNSECAGYVTVDLDTFEDCDMETKLKDVFKMRFKEQSCERHECGSKDHSCCDSVFLDYECDSESMCYKRTLSAPIQELKVVWV